METKELRSRQDFRCVHGHNGLAHRCCFDKDNAIKEKVGYLDIECSGLQADFGIVLSYCIKEDGGKIIGRHLTPSEIRNGIYDKNLIGEICEDIRKFDRIITWYGAGFDIPFLKTRCILHNQNFPVVHEVLHTDAWFVCKKKLKLHSNRLGSVAPFFGIPAKDHPLNPTVWIRCLGGDLKSLKFVFLHNKEDVISLEGTWKKMQRYAKLNKTSI